MVQKTSEKYFLCLYLLIDQFRWVNELCSKNIFKNALSGTSTHDDVTDLVNHGMVQNTKI